MWWIYKILSQVFCKSEIYFEEKVKLDVKNLFRPYPIQGWRNFEAFYLESGQGEGGGGRVKGGGGQGEGGDVLNLQPKTFYRRHSVVRCEKMGGKREYNRELLSLFGFRFLCSLNFLAEACIMSHKFIPYIYCILYKQDLFILRVRIFLMHRAQMVLCHQFFRIYDDFFASNFL